MGTTTAIATMTDTGQTTGDADLSAAVGGHKQYNPKTGQCFGGTSWCTDNILGVNVPLAAGIDANGEVTKGAGAGGIVLWPAYVGMRLWVGAWVAIPRLFGYHYRVVVVDGRAGARLMREPKGQRRMTH